MADVRRRAPHVRDRGPPPHLRRHHRPRRHRLGPEHRVPAGERAPLSLFDLARSCVGPPPIDRIGRVRRLTRGFVLLRAHDDDDDDDDGSPP